MLVIVMVGDDGDGSDDIGPPQTHLTSLSERD